MSNSGAGSDDPGRLYEIRKTIADKYALRRFYEAVYERYQACLDECPHDGLAIELGSGAGFARERIPDLIATDVIEYAGLDRVVDATAMPFGDESLRAIFGLNVFHHIPDPEAFLREAQRCLKVGGRVLLVDQHPGLLGKPILRYVHHEPFDDQVPQWKFESTGPLSDANGALAWIVFRRDAARLAEIVPQLECLGYRPHTPLGYWMAGGLKSWSLVPRWAYSASTALDRLLLSVSKDLGCFVDIQLVKR